MTRKIKPPEKQEFANLYITENLSIRELAEHFKVGRSTVDNWIKAFQIVKPKELIAKCKEKANLKKFGYTNVALIPGYRKQTHTAIAMPSYDDFYKYYIEANFSRAELAEHYKVGKSTIDKWINFHKIKKSQDLINRSIKNCMVKKYGIENISQLQDIKDKKEQIFKEHFGVKTSLQLPEIRLKQQKATKAKYGEQGVLGNAEIKAKIKDSVQAKYGVNNVMQLPENKNKRIETNKKRYGKEYYSQTDIGKQQIRNTCLQKYGKDNYFKTKEFEEKRTKTIINKYEVDSYSKTQAFKDLFKNNYDRIETKKKQTNIERFGVDSYFKTAEHKTFIKEYMKKYYTEIQQKIYETKKKNNSFNKSTQEEMAYIQLLEKFGTDNVIRQYRSKEYPYACDFYIKSLGLYIECHFSWTHGGKPFENSKEDLLKLNEWQTKAKEKNFKGIEKTYYDNAIEVWTKSDPQKLKVFTDNKLNFKIFYTLDDFNQWYKTV